MPNNDKSFSTKEEHRNMRKTYAAAEILGINDVFIPDPDWMNAPPTAPSSGKKRYKRSKA